MALTRKMLSAMDIPAEKIDEIINAHTESINGLKDERDKALKDLEDIKGNEKDLATVKKELEEANAELEKFKTADWEKKYNDLKNEYGTYKTDVEAKATKAAKASAYRKLLTEAGVSAKRLDSILKISDVDSIELDKDGNIKDVDKLKESVKTEWADFIQTSGEKGANVSNPPAGDDKSKSTGRAAQLVAQYQKEHYGNPIKEE